MTYRLVIIESPYAGSSSNRLIAFFQRWRNRRYARACVRDSLIRGEAPIASHLLYTRGIDAGLAWRSVAEATIVYMDHGVTDGMRYEIAKARTDGKEVEYRKIN
jgi:hypothetical protein